MDTGQARGEHLLVLAGPMGAGKSTLLTNALLDKAPLFGPDIDAVFQKTALPHVEKEFRMPLSEVLKRGTWACDPHVRELAEGATPPQCLVVHLDLNDFCDFAARPFASALLVGDNLARMQAHANARIFARYCHVHIATLETSYALCARWYAERSARWGKSPRDNDVLLYGGGDGEAALASICAAWRLFAATLDNVVIHWRISYDGERVMRSVA